MNKVPSFWSYDLGKVYWLDHTSEDSASSIGTLDKLLPAETKTFFLSTFYFLECQIFDVGSFFFFSSHLIAHFNIAFKIVMLFRN